MTSIHNKRCHAQNVILFLIVTTVIGCSLIMLGQPVFIGQPALAFDNTKHSLIGKQKYIRDHLGYLYPKGYFDVPPEDTKSYFKNVRGQHSDTIMSECNDSMGVHPNHTNKLTGWVEPRDYLKNYKNPCWYEEPRKKLQCVPYFYLIGMAKAGSTDLYFQIHKHPHVANTYGKEYRWFGNKRYSPDKRYRSKLSYYLGFLSKKSVQVENTTSLDTGFHPMIIGDGSPSYAWDNIEWYQAPENQYCLEPRTIIMSYIHHLFPSAKLILILRNPVDRLYSHYTFHVKRTQANGTAEEFHEWAEKSLNTYKECFKTRPFRQCIYSKEIKNSLRFKPVPSSIYSRLILDILKIFPREQLFILQMEDYSANMKERLKEVYDFLGLDGLTDSQMDEIVIKHNQNKGKRYSKSGAMLNKTRKMLTDFYQPFNEELAKMMNDSKYLWLPK